MKQVNNLQEVKDAIESGVTIIKVGMPFCGPCSKLESIIESIENEYPNVDFLSVNAEDLEDIIDMFSIKNVPTLLKFENNIETKRFIGSMPANKIKEFINE